MKIVVGPPTRCKLTFDGTQTMDQTRLQALIHPIALAIASDPGIDGSGQRAAHFKFSAPLSRQRCAHRSEVHAHAPHG